MDDPVLVQKAKAGDAKAFEALATPCEPMIWRVCWHMMGNREDAQDCAQEAFLKAWSRISSWAGTASFSTWLYRIAVTCCLDALRKKKVRASDSVDAMQESGHEMPSTAPGPQESLEHTEHTQAVRDALSSLPSEQRTPLILSCVEGKSYEEIALILSLPPGTVKSRISRGRIALRKLLSDPPNDRNKMNSTPSKQMKGGASHDL